MNQSSTYIKPWANRDYVVIMYKMSTRVDQVYN